MLQGAQTFTASARIRVQCFAGRNRMYSWQVRGLRNHCSTQTNHNYNDRLSRSQQYTIVLHCTAKQGPGDIGNRDLSSNYGTQLTYNTRKSAMPFALRG